MMELLREEIMQMMRKVKLPPEIVEMAGGDPEEFAGFVTQVAQLVATCMVREHKTSRVELAMLAYEFCWTRAQAEMARQALVLNEAWLGDLR